jgi:hypothetical protein
MMADKIWIAEMDIAYEGSEFLGAFSTAERAINACKKHANNKDYTELVFDKNENNNYMAMTGVSYIHYYVFGTEIDAED